MTAQQAPQVLLAAGPAPARRRLPFSDPLIVAALTLLALALRLPNIGRAYWIDEAISVGIASHRVSRIPSLLRHDGSPPLFYLVLHYWMAAFGTSEVATHSLALLISLLAVPVAYWAGTQLFDRRAGLAAAALMATSPFLGWYSGETRMYPLVVVLSMVGVTLAWKAVTDRRPVDVAGAILAFAALLYTHNWGIYLAFVTAGVLFVVAAARRDRRLAAQIAAVGAAVVVLWLPWLPTFLYQAHNTAAPWAVRPNIGDFFADPSSALGGTLGFLIVPLLVAGVFLARPARRAGDSYVSGLIGAIGLLTALTGFLMAQIEPSWTVRYLAVAVGPLLLGATGALAPSRRGRAVVAGCCTILAAWSVTGSLLPNANSQYAKSNARAVARAASPGLSAGDVVVVTQTEQLAAMAHYLPRGLLYVTPTGPVADPTSVDWRNIVPRLQASIPCDAVAPTIDALPVGATVLEVNPARSLGAAGSAWSKAVNAQVFAIDSMLARDPALTPIGLYNPALTPKPFSPVDAVMFRKTSALPSCA